QQSAKAKYKGGKRANFFFNLFISPAFRFVVNYVVRGGFREGFHGFVYCSLASYLTLLKYIRLYDYKVDGLPPEKDLKLSSKGALGMRSVGARRRGVCARALWELGVVGLRDARGWCYVRRK